MEVKELQPLKADTPMRVTELGILMEVKELQFEKTSLSMRVTELGMLMEVKELQYEESTPFNACHRTWNIDRGQSTAA